MKNHKHGINRRQFLHNGALLAASGMAFMTTPSLFCSPVIARAATDSLDIKPQRKALVFIMLDGGNDAYNMLVPISGAHYREYAETRGNLALDRETLLPLNYQDSNGLSFGLHLEMAEVARLFHDRNLSFVANIGPMVEPVTKERFYGGAQLPLGLLSHADQFNHWQTARADQRTNHGWFGKIADALQPELTLSQIPMNISLAGSNIMQNGTLSGGYAITEQGSTGLVVNEVNHPLNRLLLDSFETILTSTAKPDPFSTTYLQQTRSAQAQHHVFHDATKSIQVPVPFSNSSLSRQLYKVVQTISVAERLGHQQQTFFIRYIGWDHHDELLNNQAAMLGIVSKALGEFHAALSSMGLSEKVITFTGSDFGRTLTSNGNGTDHGWGGISMVMGGDVRGGQIYGQYPKLSLGDNNHLDVGNGVLIPTTPTELLYKELAEWFGVSTADSHRLFPNLSNFHGGNHGPLGVLGG